MIAPAGRPSQQAEDYCYPATTENEEETMFKTIAMLTVLVTTATGVGVARAQTPQASAPPPTTPYGSPIGIDEARAVAVAAGAEAKKIGAFEAIAIVDPSGSLVYFERMDNTQYGSIRVAIDKARSAAQFRRPTKVFSDLLVHGNMALLGLRGAVPLDGGVPLISSGKIIGAIGASGGAGPQDGQVVKAGADAVK
jgi:glc operon protein GlcG